MIKRVVSLFFLLTMLCSLFSIFASAETTNQAVVDAQSGIVKIWKWCKVFDSSKKLIVEGAYAWGTGFLIGTDGVSKTVVTNWHVANTADAPNFTGQIAGATQETSLKVSVVNDIKIDATIKQKSEGMDFAILEMSQPIYTKVTLKLKDSDKVNVTDTVYALGYPGAAGFAELKQTYDAVESITVTKGAISKISILDNLAPVFQHSAFTSGGNSGGPLLDENGMVIGINTWTDSATGNYSFSTRINEVKKALDALGIGYTKADSVSSNSSSSQVVSSEVSSAITSQTQVTSSTIPEKKSGQIFGINSAVVIIVGILLLVLIIALVLVIVLKGKGNNKTQNNQVPQRMAPNMPMQEQTPPMQQQQAPVYNPNSRISQPAPVANETTVLSSGGNETTVLGASQYNALLVRAKTGEKIYINKPMFRLGKEKGNVDYFIGDNSAVSRTHAAIVIKNGEYFILDNKSMNHTYLNGVIIPGNVETKINQGDKIKLADEEFEFKMS